MDDIRLLLNISSDDITSRTLKLPRLIESARLGCSSAEDQCRGSRQSAVLLRAGNLETSGKMVEESRPAHNSAGGQESCPERPSGNQGGKTSVKLLSNVFS